MTPKFAAAVDPIISYVLEVLKRIGRNESIDHVAEHQQIRELFTRSEAMLGQSEDWELAKYALVAWIDDILIETPWDGHDWWDDDPLEVHFWGYRNAYTKFYKDAEAAKSLSSKDALEVFYVCVVLGFRGLYRNPKPGAEAEDLGLPPDLDTWSRQVARVIRLGQGIPPLSGTFEKRKVALPLEGKYMLVGSLTLTILVGGLTLFVFFLL